MKPPDYRWINKKDDLEKLAYDLSQERAFAVDLEADSLFHYQEKVCLIQLASSRFISLVDPLGIPDLTPLAPVFSNPGIQKIFHGSDYDIRSLYRDFEIEVVNLFDTELACRFLGMKQSGLNVVLKEQFDVVLDKRFQKKDWSERPLSKEMQEYAARDVQYLIPLAGKLSENLVSMGRLDWFYEDCYLISQVRYTESNHQPRFVKIKGAGRLYPRSLAILESLLSFRDGIAMKKNKPPFKILGNTALLEISTKMPRSVESLHRLGILSGRQIGMYGDDLINRVHRALEIPEADLPVFPRHTEPLHDSGYVRRLNALKQIRLNWSESLSMDAGFICNNALLNRIALNPPSTIEELAALPGFKSWQIRILGSDLIRTMHETG
jgi:ribonuclease D